MTINPCCIPLKTGVRMVTHLSMALALAVGWTALKLISISSEVSLNDETTTSSTGVIKPIDPRAGMGSSNVFIEQQSPPPPQSFYNAHIFESHQVPPQYRIPYEYILYHKWHQQQQQMLQQQHYPGVEGYHHNLESQHQQQQQQRSYYDDIFSSWYQQQQQQRKQHTLPSLLEKEDGNGFESFSTTGPMPPPPPPPPLPHQEHHQNSHVPPSREMTDVSGYDDDDDEQSKIFRSVLHHRKNFKGAGPPSSSRPTGDLTSRRVKRINSTRVEQATDEEGDDDRRSKVVASTMPKQLASSFKLVQTQEEQTGEGEQVSKDRFSSSSSPLPLFPLQDGKNSDSSSQATVVFSSSAATVVPSQTQLSRSTVRRQQHQWRSPQSEQKNDEENSQEMNRPRTMMMMMSKLSRENSQRDGVGYNGGISERGSSSSKKPLPDFKEQYAKTLLVCGLLALCTVVFQFLTSFLLLCFVDKGSNAAAQIWTAVHCSVIFCLATCLVLFLCEGLSMPKYIFDETLYLSLITVDSLLSIYFLWVVMAFI